MSKRFGVLAVVALVLLAGCSGGPAGGGDAGDATATEASTTTQQSTDSQTTTTQQPTDTQTATETAGALAEQQWVNADESIDFETLREIHADALADASAYEFSMTQANEDGSGTESSVAVDRDAGRVHLDIASQTGDEAEQIQETYVADGTLYSRSGTEGDVTYGSQDATSEEVDQLARQQSRIASTGGVADALEWEYVGVDDDGQYQFEADSIVASDETSFDADNATTSTGTLVVDETDHVAELSMSLTISTGDGERSASLSYTTTGVGDTTVDEPAWIDEEADAS